MSRFSEEKPSGPLSDHYSLAVRICWFRMNLFVAILFSLNGNLMAQKDSVDLVPVTVMGFTPEHFMSGLKIQKMDTAVLNRFRFQNLGDLLSFHTTVAFKNYGPGQLNTASFRGTSANHTAVLWNGLNINSPALGQTDFSTIPIAGFDQLSVQYGSAASAVGSDAVGGSILLGSTAQPLGISAYKAEYFDSFVNYQSQAGAGYGARLKNEWGFSGKTAVNYNVMQNRFGYAERKGYAMLPSETIQKGFVQDLFFTKNEQEISAHVWLTKNSLTLTPKQMASRELTQTEAYRTMVRYYWKDMMLRTSWVRDVIDYATGDYTNTDHAVTDRFSNRAEKDIRWNMGSRSTVHVKAGGEWAHYRTKVAGYEKPLITENRMDLFLLTRWQITSAFLVSGNLRQAFVTRFDPPLTPSLGAEYQFIQHTRYGLKIKGSYAGSYRVPTLNERYWKTLGNPDIVPESGRNKEAGLEQRYTLKSGHLFTANITGYSNRVKNWAYWNPAKNFYVENLQEVLARGVEFQAGWKGGIRLLKAGADIGYAWNKSTQEKVYDAYAADIVGKQLVYVPVHSGNMNGFVQYRNTRLTAQIQAVGKRFTTFDNSRFYDGYLLTNLVSETTWEWGRVNLVLQAQINNIANTFYLNVRNNAMPGRSFAVNLLVNYNSAKSW
jgi:vitamin B12 transporter